ncbi:AI-2E family transporter [Kineococcus rhizosphaerae]|uniref:Putative PurR-regulated permease PerM n=1 Tax=Kineococcus rhizosphaerae TaxID=559628 RepID=A0A2T0R4D1_9ACTN|nr:AI-2E family transporter [Kineococcus rhizosphaerae]PRY15215.1 putative PurR-regulated permease PerM [Kineococcus rhizosphaerae]
MSERPPGPDAVHRPYVSPALRTAADWSWRFVIVVAGVVLLAYGLSFVSEIFIPVLIAMLITALLSPVVNLLNLRLHVPRAVSVLVTLLVAAGIVAGLVTIVGSQASSQWSKLADSATQGVTEVERWLSTGPLHLTSTAISDYVSQIETAISDNKNTLIAGATGVVSTAGHVVAGFFICLFTSFFFLLEGRRIWSWLLHLLPVPARDPLDDASRQSWVTLTHYMRATIIVAFVDGLGVAIGAAVLKVPLATSLGLLVFLGAFIPIVGALLSGTVAVLVALVAHDFVTALIMLGVVILVQQVESHLLQPFLMGRAVAVHPLAVILAVAGGATVFGIVGALFAVPLVAVLKTGVGALARGGRPSEEVRQIEDSDAPLAPDTPAPNDATEHERPVAGDGELRR